MMKRLFISSLFFVPFLSVAQRYNDDCLDTLEVQNAIYTKMDGYLDNFSIRFQCPPTDFHIALYDRHQKKVYESDDHNFVWYCKGPGGVRYQTGTFMWVMRYTFNNRVVHKRGEISLSN